MKKILLAALFLSATVGAFAQGTVQFRGYWASTTPAIDARVYLNNVGGTLLDGSNTAWRVALIGGPTTATPASVYSNPNVGTLQMMYFPSATTLTWVNFATGTTAPNLSGIPRVGLNVPRAVPGVDYGPAAYATVQMVAWQGNYNTWAEAFNAWNTGTADVLIGASNPLTLKLPTSATDPAATYLWGLNSFAIVPVPEPTTFALAGLGAAALLIFRRRN